MGESWMMEKNELSSIMSLEQSDECWWLPRILCFWFYSQRGFSAVLFSVSFYVLCTENWYNLMAQ